MTAHCAFRSTPLVQGLPRTKGGHRMTKTANYNLKKPEPTDPLRVEDFNENADKIDAALGNLNTAATKIAMGSYTGTGTSDRDNPNILTFDFAPKALFVWGNGYVALGIRDQKLQSISSDNDAQCTTTWSGNTVQWYSGYSTYQMNSSGETYCYLAIG